MHATNSILCSFLCPMVTKARFNFQANPISSFREKVEQTDKSDDADDDEAKKCVDRNFIISIVFHHLEQL